jgi:predicted transcriptional regulator
VLVKEAMSTKVESIGPQTTVRECARKMNQLGIGALPVWEDGSVVGFVTDRDICCRTIGGGKDPGSAVARDIMTRDVASCFEDQHCAEAARLMKERHVRRLAVINRHRMMVGLFSVDDLARYSHDLAGEVLEAAAPWPH